MYDPTSGLKVRTRADKGVIQRGDTAPALLAAINKNGLVFFLIVSDDLYLLYFGNMLKYLPKANLGTGVVNMMMETMYADDTTSLAILILYTLSICAQDVSTRLKYHESDLGIGQDSKLTHRNRY